MEETKESRWRVTYTKHLKQKRKVYHDGFLELNASGDKVRLYDESENLIESKFPSKAESVECGKSFTMGSHLVDIADSVHLPSDPTVTPLAQQNGNKRNSFHRTPLHKVSNVMQRNNKAAYKKAEPCTTGVPSSNSTLPLSLLEEWSVLYTTQLTQKAKKYHDGKLRFSQLGSHAKQVRLYDEHERLLESKVLGKEDVLESDKTLIMQAHLVDIGASTLQVGKGNSSISSVRKPFQKAASTIHSVVAARKEATSVEPSTPGKNSILKEWNVLYTAQLNRKAKTYHDGILRLSQAMGSLSKQITLLREDGQILSSRYLKSLECVESGAECELTGYQVQVYDLRVCQEECAGSNQRSPLEQFVKSKTLVKSIPASNIVENDEMKKEQVQNMNKRTGTSTEIEKSTNSKKCISVARHNECADSNQRSPLEQFVKSKTLVKSIPASNIVENDEMKKEQVQNMNKQTGSSTEMGKSTNSKKCISVARRDECAGSNQRSPLEQFVKSKTLVKSIPASNIVENDEMNKDQVQNMNKQTGSSTEMEKLTNSKKCINVARRDACQIMSVLKKPTAVPERGVAQAAKKAHLSLNIMQIDCELPSAQGMHDRDANADHRPMISPSSMETGSKASEEVQIVVKENCSSSGMQNSSSGLSAATVSASYEGGCEGIILEDLKKAEEKAASVEASFDDTDNKFDFPSFDLGF